MTQPDSPGRRSSRRRAATPRATAHPTPARPSRRRGGDRRPWPTAPTTTRVSPGKPTAGATRSRVRGSAATPTPATVWTAGSTPIDLDTTWPAALVERIVTGFSKPGAQVVLLVWPTPDNNDNNGVALVAVAAGGGGVDVKHAPGTESGITPGTETGPQLADAVRTVECLGRATRVVRVPVDPTVPGPVSRPFWADLIGGTDPAPETVPPVPAVDVEVSVPDAATGTIGGADLVVTSLSPHHSGELGADLVALLAARLLRVGGMFVTLTHCDWSGGELTDPTGPLVAAGQNADLLYLQHIVAVHEPVRGGRFHPADEHPAEHSGEHVKTDAGDDSSHDLQARGRHRAPVRGLPAPHRRIHSDILVFAQPHDHQPHDHEPLPASVHGPSDGGPLDSGSLDGGGCR